LVIFLFRLRTKLIEKELIYSSLFKATILIFYIFSGFFKDTTLTYIIALRAENAEKGTRLWPTNKSKDADLSFRIDKGSNLGDRKSEMILRRIRMLRTAVSKRLPKRIATR